MLLLDFGLLALIVLYTYAAPYTKVEESFNIQAIHDILHFGISRTALSQFDHFEFPGVVPRTFIGALCIAGIVKPIELVLNSFFGIIFSGKSEQLLVRTVLGLINGLSLITLRWTIARTYGKAISLWYIAFQSTQFHVIYYASRTLPNMFAFPLTTLATSYLISPCSNIYIALSLLTISSIIFRSEIVVLLGCTTLYHLVVTNRIVYTRTAKIGLQSALVACVLSFSIDSYFWQKALIPEVVGFYFNAVQGKSNEWGRSPFYQYALDLVKLFLNPAALLCVPIAWQMDARVKALLIPPVGFVAIYSILPHKEWRFIVYVVPQLTLVSAIGANYLYNKRSKNAMYRIVGVVLILSIPASALLSLGMMGVSRLNYPGGYAISRLPEGSMAYLDVMTCMTGSTRFLQTGGTYSKTEDEKLLRNASFWNELQFACVADPSVLIDNYDQWMTEEVVKGFAGFDKVRRRIRMEEKLYLMRNTKFNSSQSTELKKATI